METQKPQQQHHVDLLGLNSKQSTPFGELVSVYADEKSLSRPYKPIEEALNKKIMPYITAYNSDDTSASGHFENQLRQYAEQSILKQFHTSPESHFAVPIGRSSGACYSHIARILQVDDLTKLAVQRQKDFLESEKNPYRPVVYMSKIQTNYANYLAWAQIGCQVKNFEEPRELLEMMLQNKHLHLQIISTAGSEVTQVFFHQLKQVLEDYQEIAKTDNDAVSRFFVISDVSALLKTERLDLSIDGVNQSLIDFVLFSINEGFVGGQDGASIIIGKNKIKEESTVQSLEQMPENIDLIAFYRTALVLEHQESVGLDTIKKKQKEILGLFLHRVSVFNSELRGQLPIRKVKVYYSKTDQQHHEGEMEDILDEFQQNDPDKDASKTPKNTEGNANNKQQPNRDKNYSAFRNPDRSTSIRLKSTQIMQIDKSQVSFNILGPCQNTDSDGNSVFPQAFLVKALSDLFGIQASVGYTMQSSKDETILVNIKAQTSLHLSTNSHFQKILKNREAACITISTNYMQERSDMNYILDAIKIILHNGENLLQYYEAQKNGAYELKHFYQKFLHAKFSLQSITQKEQKPNQNRFEEDFPPQERANFMKIQLLYGEEIIKNPKRFIDNHNQGQILIKHQLDLFVVQNEKAKQEQDHHTMHSKKASSVKSSSKKSAPSFQNVTESSLKQNLPQEEQEMIENLLSKLRVDIKQISTVPPSTQHQYQHFASDSSKPGSQQDKKPLLTLKEVMAIQNPPSKRFDNNLTREKRYQHLSEIFDHYKNMHLNAESHVGMFNYHKFFKFSQDFVIADKFFNVGTLQNIYRKAHGQQNTVKTELTLAQFMISLENMAMRIYQEDDSIPSLYDKVEEFYRYLGIDDPNIFRKKLNIAGSMEDNTQFEISGDNISNNNTFLTRDLQNIIKGDTQRSAKQTLFGKKKYYMMQNEVPKKFQYSIWEHNKINSNPQPYQDLHQINSLKHLKLDKQVASYPNLKRMDMKDFNVALREKSFDPQAIIDIDNQYTEDNYYLAEFDLREDLERKKKRDQEIRNKIEKYGEIQSKLRPTQIYMMRRQAERQALADNINQRQYQENSYENSDYRYRQRQQDSFDQIKNYSMPPSVKASENYDKRKNRDRVKQLELSEKKRENELLRLVASPQSGQVNKKYVN